jgi:hypothetical protein
LGLVWSTGSYFAPLIMPTVQNRWLRCATGPLSVVPSVSKGWRSPGFIRRLRREFTGNSFEGGEAIRVTRHLKSGHSGLPVSLKFLVYGRMYNAAVVNLVSRPLFRENAARPY